MSPPDVLFASERTVFTSEDGSGLGLGTVIQSRVEATGEGVEASGVGVGMTGVEARGMGVGVTGSQARGVGGGVTGVNEPLGVRVMDARVGVGADMVCVGGPISDASLASCSGDR